MSGLNDDTVVKTEDSPPCSTEIAKVAEAPRTIETIVLSSDIEPSDVEDDLNATAVHACTLLESSGIHPDVENDAPQEVQPLIQQQTGARAIRRVISLAPFPRHHIPPRPVNPAKPSAHFPSGVPLSPNIGAQRDLIQNLSGISTNSAHSFGKAPPLRRFIVRSSPVNGFIRKVGNVTVIRKYGVQRGRMGAGAETRETVPVSNELPAHSPLPPHSSGPIGNQQARFTLRSSLSPSHSSSLASHSQSVPPSSSSIPPVYPPVRLVTGSRGFILPPANQHAVDIGQLGSLFKQWNRSEEMKDAGPAALKALSRREIGASMKKINDALNWLPPHNLYSLSIPRLPQAPRRPFTEPLPQPQLDSQQKPRVTTLADCLGHILEDRPISTELIDLHRVCVGRVELLEDIGMEHTCILCGETVGAGLNMDFFDPLVDHLLMTHIDACHVFRCGGCKYSNASEGITNWHVANRHFSCKTDVTRLEPGERLDVLVRQFFPSSSKAIRGPADSEEAAFMRLHDNSKFMWLVGSRGYVPPLNLLNEKKAGRPQFSDLAEALDFISSLSESPGSSQAPSPSD